jgi:hypothetical protein
MSRMLFQRSLGLVALIFASLAGGCSSAKPTMISSDPQGAKLQVNGKDIGAAPTTYTFSFSDTSSYDLTAAQPGYLDTKTKVTSDSPDLKTGLVKITLTADQAFSSTVPSDAANQWVLVQTDPKLNKETVWQKVVSAASDRYTHMTLLDEASGYLQSDSLSRPFPQPARSGMTVRTQMIAAIASQQPLVYKVKLVSQISYGDAPNSWTDYPRVFPEDAALVNQIRSQIGVQ